MTRNPILRIALCGALLMGCVNLACADDRENEVKRVKAAADVLDEIMAAPDKGIPQEAPAGSGPFLSAVKKFSAKAEAAKLNDRNTDRQR